MSAFDDSFGPSGFDANSVEPATDFDVLPPGEYTVSIDRVEIKQTKKADGHYVGLKLQVLEGARKGQVVFDCINFNNPSEVCVAMGLRSLAALGQAVGVDKITDPELQLVGKVCVAHVKVDSKSNMNNVKTYSACNKEAPPIQPSNPSSNTQPDGAPGNLPPWGRGQK